MSMHTVYKLKHPVDIAGETLSQLKVRRPNAGDMMAMDDASGDIGKLIKLLSSCADEPESTIKKLDGEDLAGAGNIVKAFLLPGQATGAKR